MGVGRWGRLALAFVCEAETADAAVASAVPDVRTAVPDVRTAVPDARLVEVSPDLVGLTDVAALLNVSRQNVRKLILACNAPAPAPVHEGRPTIWRLAKVLAWLCEEKQYLVPPELLEIARATMQASLAVQAPDADSVAQGEFAGV